MLNSKLNVTYKKQINYDILIEHNIFDPENKSLLIGGEQKNSCRLVVVDSFIYDLYSSKIEEYFYANNVRSKIIRFEGGEKNKNIENYTKLLAALDEFPINRVGEPIIAIGGGVTTDIVGFVASCHRRGVPHIKVPTTLMGYVDASIGIKTGINFGSYKNRVGTFEAPKSVILDKTFLKSLPERHILNGVGEIVKLAVIKDYTLFEQLEGYGNECIESKFQTDKGQFILDASITGMLEELEPNLYEDNLERCVDFGHTFSLVLEMNEVGDLLHGEAVSIDIAFSAILATVHSVLSLSDQRRILNLIKKLNLPYYHSGLKPKLLWKSLIERTHHRGGLQRIPFPSSIGKYVFINDIKYEEIVEACAILENYYIEEVAAIKK